ncbi:hypothetical protein [Corynebacterium durum]|uniref:hypothetical protein n=1 Tax=Corynebacterium durum TaxID=61592 RepID=UPI00288A2308|nr:hypothetical protein [Corynebacterium durum]
MSDLKKFYWELYSDRSWLLRQVNTIKLVDTKIYEKRSTYDIDCRNLRDRASQCGIDPNKEIILPLWLGEQKTLIDLDIRDEYGVCLPLIKSDDAEQFMNIALCGALGPTFDDMSSGEQRVCIDMVTAMMNERPITYSQSRIWKHISNSQQAFDFINSFYEFRGRKLYAIHLNVQQRESISIIKTREVIPGLQFTNGRLELWAKSLDEDVASNYICVESPDGTWISNMSLLFEGKEISPTNSEYKRNSTFDGPTYSIQDNYARSLLHSTNLKSGRKALITTYGEGNTWESLTGRAAYTVAVELQPKRSYYLGPHLAVFAISSAIYALLMIISFAFLRRWISGGAWVPLNISAIVTLMAVIPTAHAAVLFYGSEHRILSQLYRHWRFTGYALSAFNLILAASMSVLPLKDGDGYYVSAAWLFSISSIGFVTNFVGEVWCFKKFQGLHRKIVDTSAPEQQTKALK